MCEFEHWTCGENWKAVRIHKELTATSMWRWQRSGGGGGTLDFHVSDRSEGKAYSSMAAEGGWGEHCTGL